jgi:mono/diheme cytochrome c family protein
VASNRSRLIRNTALATLALAAAAALGLAALVMKAGWYHVGASQPHLQAVHLLLEQGMRDSVQHHARGLQAPVLGTPERVARGGALYVAHCQACHGGPGVGPERFGMAMQPAPGPLVDAARRWQAQELYWIVRHGIKLTGMPAWDGHLEDEQLWDVVAFLLELPQLAAADYRAIGATPAPARAATPGTANAERGRAALFRYACQGCHMIPGVTGSPTHVGPALDRIGSKPLLAGRLPNTPENMAAWIRTPQAFDPASAMPSMGVTPQQAADMAAYLHTLR